MDATLPLIMEEYARGMDFPFYVAMVIPKIGRDEIDKLTTRASIKRMKLVLRRTAEDLYRFDARLVKRSSHGYILARSDKVWFFIGRSDSIDSFAKVIKKLYPLIALPIIHVNDFTNILDDYVKYYDVIVLQFLLRKRIARETTKKWLKKSYWEVIDKINKIMREEHTVLDSIRLLVKSKYNHKSLELAITRKGLFTIYMGTPELFVDLVNLVFEPFMVKAIEERRKLGEVKRYIDKETGEARAKIVQISFSNKASLNDFTKFIEALSKTHYISVYNKGNPYLHLLAIDKGNGSSYEVFATSTTARIIPRTKSEVDSLYLILEALSDAVSFDTIKLEE